MHMKLQAVHLAAGEMGLGEEGLESWRGMFDLHLLAAHCPSQT